MYRQISPGTDLVAKFCSKSGQPFGWILAPSESLLRRCMDEIFTDFNRLPRMTPDPDFTEVEPV